MTGWFRKRDSEIPIHYSVYRARPDVSSICHVHPPNVVLLTLVGETIRPLTMSSISYPRGVPVFKRLGLIITDELGDGMVKAMGKKKAVILRAHGARLLKSWSKKGLPDR